MKKRFACLLALSTLSLMLACTGNSQKSSLQNSVTTSSENVTTSSQETTSSSSSSSKSKNSSVFIKDNELATASGIVVKFNAKGARIEKIYWGEKQIAKDGFTVGRCANRIAKGKFTLNGVQYTLDTNNNGNHLHGGDGGGMNSWQGPFANATWTKKEQTANTIEYTLHSNDGDHGYPGNLDVSVKYTLHEDGELAIEYHAKADQDTIFNPTNHLFMSLNGNNSNANHKLEIRADNYTPLDSRQIPTGAISPVAGTDYDYTTERAFDTSKSYDDNYVLNGRGYRKVATLTGTVTNIKVDVWTDRAGLQLYKNGNTDICLETQMFPDMINHPEFADYGSIVLNSNKSFYSQTSYCFSKVA